MGGGGAMRLTGESGKAFWRRGVCVGPQGGPCKTSHAVAGQRKFLESKKPPLG